MDGEELLQYLLVIGMIVLIIGAIVAIGGAISAGLIIMGVGLIMSGYGGTVYFQRGSLAIGGTTGAVFILAGIFLDYINDILTELGI